MQDSPDDRSSQGCIYVENLENSKQIFKCPSCDKLFGKKQNLGIHYSSIFHNKKNLNNDNEFFYCFYNDDVRFSRIFHDGFPKNSNYFKVKVKFWLALNLSWPKKYGSDSFSLVYCMQSNYRQANTREIHNDYFQCGTSVRTIPVLLATPVLVVPLKPAVQTFTGNI